MWAAAGEGGVRTTVEAVHANQDQIMLALIALLGTCVACLVWIIKNGRTIRIAADEATAANHAVNNVGGGDHKMYDMVRDIKGEVKQIKSDVTGLKKDQTQFDSHGWETLPPDIGTAVGLTTTIRDLQNNHKQVNGKLDTLISELREHVVWEMDTKYGKHGSTGEGS
jgi:hypothetical protein